jgi:hypothetical protein
MQSSDCKDELAARKPTSMRQKWVDLEFTPVPKPSCGARAAEGENCTAFIERY